MDEVQNLQKQLKLYHGALSESKKKNFAYRQEMYEAKRELDIYKDKEFIMKQKLAQLLASGKHDTYEHELQAQSMLQWQQAMETKDALLEQTVQVCHIKQERLFAELAETEEGLKAHEEGYQALTRLLGVCKEADEADETDEEDEEDEEMEMEIEEKRNEDLLGGAGAGDGRGGRGGRGRGGRGGRGGDEDQDADQSQSRFTALRSRYEAATVAVRHLLASREALCEAEEQVRDSKGELLEAKAEKDRLEKELIEVGRSESEVRKRLETTRKETSQCEAKLAEMEEVRKAEETAWQVKEAEWMDDRQHLVEFHITEEGVWQAVLSKTEAGLAKERMDKEHIQKELETALREGKEEKSEYESRLLEAKEVGQANEAELERLAELLSMTEAELAEGGKAIALEREQREGVQIKLEATLQEAKEDKSRYEKQLFEAGEERQANEAELERLAELLSKTESELAEEKKALVLEKENTENLQSELERARQEAKEEKSQYESRLLEAKEVRQANEAELERLAELLSKTEAERAEEGKALALEKENTQFVQKELETALCEAEVEKSQYESRLLEEGEVRQANEAELRLNEAELERLAELLRKTEAELTAARKAFATEKEHRENVQSELEKATREAEEEESGLRAQLLEAEEAMRAKAAAWVVERSGLVQEHLEQELTRERAHRSELEAQQVQWQVQREQDEQKQQELVRQLRSDHQEIIDHLRRENDELRQEVAIASEALKQGRAQLQHDLEQEMLRCQGKERQWAEQMMLALRAAQKSNELAVWRKDTKCRGCTQPFTLLLRRHHCRKCGESFCKTCAYTEVLMPELGFTKRARCCDPCLQALEDQRANGNTLPLHSPSPSLRTPTRTPTHSPSPVRIRSATQIERGNTPKLRLFGGSVDRNTPLRTSSEDVWVQPSEPSLFQGLTFEGTIQLERHKVAVLAAVSAPMLDLPLILPLLTSSIERAGGLQEQGIFRVSPSGDDFENAKARLERGNYNVQDCDVHVLAGLLKAWFRGLKTPLIPFAKRDACLAVGNELLHGGEGGEEVGTRLRTMVEDLTPLNRRVLYHIHHFFGKVLLPVNLACNKMTATNLAIVFAPGFLRSEQFEDPVSELASVKPAMAFVERLLLTSLEFLEDEATAEVEQWPKLCRVGVEQPKSALDLTRITEPK